MLANEKIIVGIVAVVAVIGLFVMMGGNSLSFGDLTGNAVNALQKECVAELDAQYKAEKITKREHQAALRKCDSLVNKEKRSVREEERKEERKSVPILPSKESQKSTTARSAATTGPYYEGDVCVGAVDITDCVGQIFVLSTGVQIEINDIDTVDNEIDFDVVSSSVSFDDLPYADGSETDFSPETLGRFSLTINEALAEVEFTDLTITCIDWDGGLDYQTESYTTHPAMLNTKYYDTCISEIMLEERRCPDVGEPVITPFETYDCSSMNMFCNDNACQYECVEDTDCVSGEVCNAVNECEVVAELLLPDLVGGTSTFAVELSGLVTYSSSQPWIIDSSAVTITTTCGVTNIGTANAVGSVTTNCNLTNSSSPYSYLMTDSSDVRTLNLPPGGSYDWTWSALASSFTTPALNELNQLLYFVDAVSWYVPTLQVSGFTDYGNNIAELDETNNEWGTSVTLDTSGLSFVVTP